MNNRNITIIILACIVTAVLVGVEVYFWQGGTQLSLIPGLPFTVNTIKNNPLNLPNKTGGTTEKPNANFNEIKTKAEGIAACEYNRAYAKTIADPEQKKMGEAIVDYCYAVIAGKFDDLGLCNKTADQKTCQETAQGLIEMGKEIQNMSPEERQKLQEMYKGLYKQ